MIPSSNHLFMPTRMNEQITVPEVRVIGPDGKQRGILPIAEALKLARSFGMDLVEIAPNASPPITRIVEVAKHREQAKRLKEQGPPE